MIDFIDGKSLVDSFPKRQFEWVKHAIKLPHSHDLVSGDLQPPNILIKNGGMIVDFDRCGKYWGSNATLRSSIMMSNLIGR